LLIGLRFLKHVKILDIIGFATLYALAFSKVLQSLSKNRILNVLLRTQAPFSMQQQLNNFMRNLKIDRLLCHLIFTIFQDIIIRIFASNVILFIIQLN